MLQMTCEKMVTQVYFCVEGAVERVKKIRDYAFVHFCQRDDAINAMNALNGKVSNSYLSITNWLYCSDPNKYVLLPCNRFTCREILAEFDSALS